MNGVQGADGGAAGAGGANGNQQLDGAFEFAMQQAQQTLSITTVKGAALYALKQRPQ